MSNQPYVYIVSPVGLVGGGGGVIFEAFCRCHDVLILDKCPIKWRQSPHMTIAIDWDVKHLFS